MERIRGFTTSKYQPIPELQRLLQAEPRKVDLDRKLYRVRGPWETRRYLIHNSCIENLGRGLAERVFYTVVDGKYTKPPQPEPHQFDSIDWYISKVVRAFGRKITPIDRSDFPGLYHGRKKTIYEQAVARLEEDGWDKKFGRITAFVKAEKIDATSKPDPAPRIIQPRKPEYNVELGVYLKRAEHRIYASVARALGKSPVIAKGFNALELGDLIASKWDRFNSPVAIGMDASRFDQHVSLDALHWEHALYINLTEPRFRTWLRELLDFQLCNKGLAMARDGGFKYKIDGCRMSGDMNTALGNCLLMTAMTANFCVTNKVKYDMINNGDDLVLFIEKEDLTRVFPLIPEYFLKFGFTMKVEEPVTILEQVEFCQMRPVWTPSGYMMTRHYDVVLNKDLVTILDIRSDKAFRQWMTAISDCGLALAGGIPILQTFYQQLDFKVNFDWVKEHGAFNSASWRGDLVSRSQPVHDRSRVSFGLAFGLSFQEQVEIERLIRSWRPQYIDSARNGLLRFLFG